MKKTLWKILLVIMVIVLLCFAAVSCRKEPDTPDEATSVYITNNGASEYTIVYGASNTFGGKYAYTFNQAVATVTGASLGNGVSDTTTEVIKEILLGDTNRQLSKDLKATLEESAAADSFIWGFAYRNGQFAFYFNNQVAFDKGLEQLKAEFLVNGNLVVASNTWITKELTLAAYNAEVKAEEERLKAEAAAKKEAELAKRLENVTAEIANAKYTDADFGVTDSWLTDYSMPTDKYEPATSITEEHPRVLLTKGTIPKIKALLEDPEYKNMADNFWSYADSKNFSGVFEEQTHSTGETYRYDYKVLSQIEARAMAYLVTGHKAYAYEAIHGIKNAMLSYKFTTENHVDVYHGPGEIMVTLAKVYDWCYDVLTDSDKKQLISGCVYLLIEAKHFTDDDFVLDSNKPSLKGTLNTASKSDYGLEFNFPPDNHSALTGHGTGPQFLHYYVISAISFADEMPSWWDYVGGRFYEEYLPVAKELYKNGYVTQGSANYAPIKLQVNLVPAYLLKIATGENPYPDYIAECANFMLSHMLPNGNMFETGDGPRTGEGASWGGYYKLFYYFAALYNDTFSLQAVKSFSNDFKGYEGAETLALCAACDKADGKYPDDMPLLTYVESPSGQITVRNSWNSSAAVAFMKIGGLTLAGHDHSDSGTFQIYYKGFLAVSSGSYDRYDSKHHLNYLQSTVGMNGLLIYNPNMKAKNSWYSGSQINLSSPNTMEQWLGGDYNVASVVGVENGYSSDGKTPVYSYLAGDITDSYDVNTVDHVERRMLTVYTGDEDAPMLFFVFDSITSDNENFKKSFLLHTVKEPTISGTATDKSFTITPDASGKMTATVINGAGALILQNVYGGDYMHKIGGSGYAYWIGNENEFDGTENSGFNATDEYTKTDKSDTIWGRIEITTRGEKKSDMLNVMYVTDSGEIKSMSAVLVEDEGGNAVGATIGGTTAMFIKQDQRTADSLSFTTSGSGTMKYFVSGLQAGSWNVSINGGKAVEYKVSEAGGMLKFDGAAGAVSITPGNDVLKEGFAMIKYSLAGGKLPEGSPLTYEEGKSYTLPIPTLTDGKFIGWYTESSFVNKITEIPATATGTFKVYAKFEVYDTYTVYGERDEKLKAVGATSVYFNDIHKISLGINTTNNSAWYGHKREKWTENKSALFSGVSVFDSWGKVDGDNYNGNNISSNGDGIIFSEWRSEYDQSDENNYVLLEFKDVQDQRGKNIVFSTGVTMLSDSFVGKFSYQISVDKKNTLIVTPFEIVNGQIQSGGVGLATLVKDVTTNITLNIRIVAPTEVGIFNSEDFDGANKLSIDKFQKKYGTVRYDLYIDNVKVVDNALLVSMANQKKIKNADGEVTGLATDYRAFQFMCAIAKGGEIKGVNNDYDGEAILSQEYFDLYISNTVADLYDLYTKGQINSALDEGFAMINYNLAGGSLPDGSPLTYEVGKSYTLPIPTFGEQTFKGWYSDPAFTNKITEIPATATGTFFVYAKFEIYNLYTDRQEQLDSVGGTSIYYNDISNLTLSPNTTNKEWYGHKKNGWSESKGSLFNGASIFDSWGLIEGENYNGNNISTNGNGIIYSEWKSQYDKDDKYNQVSLELKNVYDHSGKDIVFSTGVTMLSDSFKGKFSYNINVDKLNTLVVTPFVIVDGQVKSGEIVVATLEKGVTVNITLHIRIVAPITSGTYDSADFDGANKLSLAEFEKKYGTIRFDLYIDGVKVVDNELLVSQSAQAKIKNADGLVTGQATDFRIFQFVCAQAKGNDVTGVSTEFDGEAILCQEYFDIYISNTVIDIYNKNNTDN